MGRRDSRADFIDDDPFKNMQRKGPKIHRVHVRQSEDGTIHFDNRGADPIRAIMSQMWGASQEVKAKHHSGGLWHFSSEEKKHLMWATEHLLLLWDSCTQEDFLDYSLVALLHGQ